MQVRLRNVSANKIFLEALKFNSVVSKDLQLIDLNNTVVTSGNVSTVETTGQGLFDETVCFH